MASSPTRKLSPLDTSPPSQAASDSGKKRYTVELRIFLCAAFLIGLGCFFLGGFSALILHPVWDRIDNARQLVFSLVQTGRPLPHLAYFSRDPLAAPERYTVAAPSEVTPGYLAITRLDATKPGYVTELLDQDGNVQHTWNIDYPGITGEGQTLTFPHGVVPMPNGDVLVNFNLAYALARITPCGAPVWVRQDGIYHHEIARSGDEYWTWFGEGGRIYDGNELVRFDPETGALGDRYHLVDDIFLANDRNRLKMGVGPTHVFHRDAILEQGRDDFHPNDGVPLPAELAHAFPMFEAGDLLISLRNLNIVAVVDRQSMDFKWFQQGPWFWQHDPDWHADGTISIFANNPHRGRSDIYVIDPATNEITAPLEHGARFFTNIMGAHQKLPSGNWLITASRTGRVLELSPTGALVREYHNIINDKYSAIIARADWLPADFFDTMPNCTQ